MIPALCLALVATIGSITFLGHIAYSLHDSKAPRSLSELAVLESRALKKFRYVLLICGSLFALSIYLFIAPKTHSLAIAVAWSIEYIGVIFVAIIPAMGKSFKLHVAFAQFMGLGMLLLAYAFWADLHGVKSGLELVLALLMTLLAGLTYLHKRLYLQYELAFIFISHFTIVLAALSI